MVDGTAKHASAPRVAEPGSEIRLRVERLGASLADGLGVVLDGLPARPVGPQRLAEQLGLTTVTASRLLKAISQQDPIAVIQLLPGPTPLRRVAEAARQSGAPEAACDAALVQIDAFADLIRETAGDRGALRSMLSTWLPEERREFEAQRRQTMFKALAELEGVSCDLQLETILLHPSTERGMLDVANVKSLMGIDRIRPDAAVKLGTRRVPLASDEERPRVPLTLDGEPALGGLNCVRLDQFCKAPPAPLEVKRFGDIVQYSLGATGFGRDAKVDLVMAELNRAELVEQASGSLYFFSIPEMATRRLVFDLIVHEDLCAATRPSLHVHSTAAMGAARPGDPDREPDRRASTASLELLGAGTRRLRLLEFGRYGALLDHALERLGWDAAKLRTYRVNVAYPLVGRQISIALDAHGS
ncbi:MAG: hypothetical protein AAGI22_19650 [Planctomycetota bacterium]